MALVMPHCAESRFLHHRIDETTRRDSVPGIIMKKADLTNYLVNVAEPDKWRRRYLAPAVRDDEWWPAELEIVHICNFFPTWSSSHMPGLHV